MFLKERNKPSSWKFFLTQILMIVSKKYVFLHKSRMTWSHQKWISNSSNFYYLYFLFLIRGVPKTLDVVGLGMGIEGIIIIKFIMNKKLLESSIFQLLKVIKFFLSRLLLFYVTITSLIYFRIKLLVWSFLIDQYFF